jgi:hypothetical protein
LEEEIEREKEGGKRMRRKEKENREEREEQGE